MYHPAAYTISNFVVEVPWLAGIVLATTPIIYFMIGLSPAPSVFFFHYFATFILTLVYISIGQALAAGCPTFEVAQALLGIIAPLFFLYGGLWSPPSQQAAGSKWFTTIDPILYAFRAIITPHFYCAEHGTPACPTIATISPYGSVQVDRYEYVASKYELDYSQIWASVGYLSIFVAVFQALALIFTRYLRHLTR